MCRVLEIFARYSGARIVLFGGYLYFSLFNEFSKRLQNFVYRHMLIYKLLYWYVDIVFNI